MVNTYTNMTKPLFWKPSNTSSPSLYVPLVLQTLQLIACPLKNDAAKDDELNGELYNAILNEEVENVIKLCERFADHATRRLTIHEDTVLHVATYSKQTDLVLGLLEALPHHHIHKMTTSKNVS